MEETPSIYFSHDVTEAAPTTASSELANGGVFISDGLVNEEDDQQIVLLQPHSIGNRPVTRYRDTAANSGDEYTSNFLGQSADRTTEEDGFDEEEDEDDKEERIHNEEIFRITKPIFDNPMSLLNLEADICESAKS